MIQVSFITTVVQKSSAAETYGEYEVKYDSSQQKQLQVQNRWSNFVFSNERNHLYDQTTQKTDYDRKTGEYNIRQPQKPKSSTIRQTNFHLGFDKQDYKTTAQNTKGGEDTKFDPKEAQAVKQRKQKLASHSIVYGFTRP